MTGVPKFNARKGVILDMKTILAAIFAVMVGVTFAGSTFADEKKADAPAAAPAAGGEMKKDDGKKESKKAKKEKKDEKKDEKK
jgi:hypothetical protein